MQLRQLVARRVDGVTWAPPSVSNAVLEMGGGGRHPPVTTATRTIRTCKQTNKRNDARGVDLFLPLHFFTTVRCKNDLNSNFKLFIPDVRLQHLRFFFVDTKHL